MGTKKISELVETTELNDNDLIAVVDITNDATKKMKVSNFNKYSNSYLSDETRIGKLWNRPLYRKVIQTTTPSTQTENYIELVDLSDVNLVWVTRFDIFVESNATIAPLNYYHDSTHYAEYWIDYQSKKIKLNLKGNFYWGEKILIILEYTKT